MNFVSLFCAFCWALNRIWLGFEYHETRWLILFYLQWAFLHQHVRMVEQEGLTTVKATVTVLLVRLKTYCTNIAWSWLAIQTLNNMADSADSAQIWLIMQTLYNTGSKYRQCMILTCSTDIVQTFMILTYCTEIAQSWPVVQTLCRYCTDLSFCADIAWSWLVVQTLHDLTYHTDIAQIWLIVQTSHDLDL